MTAGSDAFGAGPVRLDRAAGVPTGADDLAVATEVFHALGPDSDRLVRVARCRPTAAFSRRDTHLPGYAAARAACLELGFEPVVRPVGGHLAAYDEGSLVFYLAGWHPDAMTGIEDRFAVVGAALRDLLTGLGVGDARVGAVPGEYCDGRFSVNAGGRTKLVGTGQRLRRQSALLCGVLSVLPSPAVRACLVGAYAVLDLPLDPATVGSVAEVLPAAGLEAGPGVGPGAGFEAGFGAGFGAGFEAGPGIDGVADRLADALVGLLRTGDPVSRR